MVEIYILKRRQLGGRVTSSLTWSLIGIQPARDGNGQFGKTSSYSRLPLTKMMRMNIFWRNDWTWIWNSGIKPNELFTGIVRGRKRQSCSGKCFLPVATLGASPSSCPVPLPASSLLTLPLSPFQVTLIMMIIFFMMMLPLWSYDLIFMIL